MAFWAKTKENPQTTTQVPTDAATNTTQSSDGASAAGSKPPPVPAVEQLPQEQRRKIAAASKMAVATFGEVVSVLLGSKRYRSHTLADLEWLVLPALQTRQFSLAEAQAKSNGLTAPLAVVLWASVSNAVDQRLDATPEAPVKLDPKEWKSGDIVWVVDAVGNARVIQEMLKRLQLNEWSGKIVKLRAKGRDGNPTVVTLKTDGSDTDAKVASR